MDTRRWAGDELDDLMSELRQHLGQLERGCDVVTEDGRDVDHTTPPLVDVFRLVAAARSDGWPRRSGLSGGGGPASVLDENGDPMPPKSDPTGELAILDVRTNDPVRRHAQNALRALVDARNLLRKAKSETILAFEEAGDVEVGDPGCRVHALIGAFADVSRGDRCRKCDDFFRQEGADPDAEVLRIWDDPHKRLATRDVDAWRQRQKFRGSSKKSRAKQAVA